MRPSFAELRALIASTFPDNTAGDIEPSELRTYLLGALAAVQPAYGQLLRQTLSANLTANITPPVKLTWQAAADSDPTQTTSVFAAGTIARSERGTSKIQFVTNLETNSNRFITFTLFKNGVATPWKITGNGAGAGNPVAVALTAIDYADPAATYDIRMSAETNGTVVTLSGSAMILECLPVNSY